MTRRAQGNGFEPRDLSKKHATFQLPDEAWISMLETACTFEPEFYLRVMLNMIKNPNLTSSYLFRAEVFYDSLNDVTVSQEADGEHFSGFTRHMKAEYRPVRIAVPGYERQRTLVRRMIPRNPQLDEPLVQTCHLFRARDASEERNLVVYVPHVSTAGDVPWYHPAVRALALLHTWKKDGAPDDEGARGSVSVHYRLFDGTGLDTRLERTALNLLRLIHKHGQGQRAGYVKRVHHDLLVPQAAFQDTYTRLKAKYAKALIGGWVEQTDPAKHVFEDLGIAAFLVELWAQMYSGVPDARQHERGGDGGPAKPPFPGFVDVGCGNGVLVFVLRQEGYQGWGFDARRRRTWDAFPAHVREGLKELVLVPKPLQPDGSGGGARPASTPTPHEHDGTAALTAATGRLGVDDGQASGAPATSAPARATAPDIAFHDGTFPAGTFIVSNHADELTAWTPLLAHLSASPFIAIPCCSHNLAGARFRAPASGAAPRAASAPATQDGAAGQARDGAGGGVARPAAKAPSAYASLCAWVARLAEDVGFAPEREMLRIPSTRNAAVVGRRRAGAGAGADVDARAREQSVRHILLRELGSVEAAGAEWVARASKIAGSKGERH